MALSEQEQRLLEQMEAVLTAEDPKLANALRGSSARRLHRRWAALAGLGFIVGLAALVVGMETHPIVSIVGFVVMLAATVVAITSWRKVGGGGALTNQPRTAHSDTAFIDKLEERWRRGHEDGL